MNTTTTIKQERSHRAWQITRASVVLVWALFTAIIGVFWAIVQFGLQWFGNDDDNAELMNSDRYSADNPGPCYNTRTGMWDDGGDPNGTYDYGFDEL